MNTGFLSTTKFVGEGVSTIQHCQLTEDGSGVLGRKTMLALKILPLKWFWMLSIVLLGNNAIDLGKGAVKLFSDAFNFLVGDKLAGAVPQKPKFAPSGYDATIKQSANKYKIDEDLIKAVIQAESSGNPNAMSGMGAQGLMQLMPIAVRELRRTGLDVNPTIPEQNIEGGIKYLADLVNKYEGNIEQLESHAEAFDTLAGENTK